MKAWETENGEESHERLFLVWSTRVPSWSSCHWKRQECYVLAREAGLKSPPFFSPRSVEEMKQIVADLDMFERKEVPGLPDRMQHRCKRLSSTSIFSAIPQKKGIKKSFSPLTTFLGHYRKEV